MNFNKLRDLLDYVLPMLGVPGSDTSIYIDHREVFRHQSGYDNARFGTPVRDNALYNIYSCTKVATCVSAMQLIERGEMLMDDPVYAYIPEFGSLKVRVKNEDGTERVVDSKKPMLIRHLFSMTSGLDYDGNRPGIERVKAQTEGRSPTLDIVRALAEEPLWFEPGSSYRYSFSHDVLGGVIEVVSGMKLGEYMKENLFDPLGMKRTSFDRSEERLSCLATQYAYDKERGAVQIGSENPCVFGSEYESGGAGLISCVDDYVLLADALAHMGMGKSGERILSSAAVELLRSPVVPDQQFRKWFNNVHHFGYSYCYGVRCCTDPGAAGILVPKGAFGWDGAKLSAVLADPARRVGVFHAEHMGGLHSVVLPRLLNAVYSCLDEV